jgi:hypothetical protein
VSCSFNVASYETKLDFATYLETHGVESSKVSLTFVGSLHRPKKLWHFVMLQNYIKINLSIEFEFVKSVCYQEIKYFRLTFQCMYFQIWGKITAARY